MDIKVLLCERLWWSLLSTPNRLQNIYISKENPALYIPVFSKEMRTGEKKKEKKLSLVHL